MISIQTEHTKTVSYRKVIYNSNDKPAMFERTNLGLRQPLPRPYCRLLWRQLKNLTSLLFQRRQPAQKTTFKVREKLIKHNSKVIFNMLINRQRREFLHKPAFAECTLADVLSAPVTNYKHSRKESSYTHCEAAHRLN